MNIISARIVGTTQELTAQLKPGTNVKEEVENLAFEEGGYEKAKIKLLFLINFCEKYDSQKLVEHYKTMLDYLSKLEDI